jgi:hypothetical protein
MEAPRSSEHVKYKSACMQHPFSLKSTFQSTRIERGEGGGNKRKSKRVPFIFNDKSTGSCICLRLDLYLSRVKTCATAVCFCFYLCSPTPPTTRSHTCAYVTRMKDNFSRSFERRHVIPNTRISSGQCPRCHANVTLGSRDFQGHAK